MEGKLVRFAERMISVFNRSLRKALDENGEWYRREKELTKERFLEIIIVFWGPEEKVDNYTKKLASNKFTEENLKDIVSAIKNKGDEEHGGDANFVREVLDEMNGYETKLIKKISENVAAQMSNDLNQMWYEDVKLPQKAKLPIWEIVSYYFLDSTKLKFTKLERPKGKRIDNYLGGEKYIAVLEDILNEHNLAIVQGEHSSGKTTFVEWYVKKKNKSMIRICWNDAMDINGIFCAVPTIKKDVMEQVGFKMNCYGEEFFAEDAMNSLLGISSNNDMVIVIDDFNGAQEILDELRKFATKKEARNAFQIILITNGNYVASGQELTISPLDKDGLRKLFEIYSGIHLESDVELDNLVDRISEEMVGWPTLMILLGEAYASNIKMGRDNAFILLTRCLGITGTSVINDGRKEVQDQEQKFNSAVDYPQQKLSGHIYNIYHSQVENVDCGVIFLISCLRNIQMPAYYLYKLCEFKEGDMRSLCSSHWITMEDGIVHVKVPFIVAVSLIKNKKDRRNTLKSITNFLTKFNNELRNEESEHIEKNWMLSVIKEAHCLSQNLHQDSFKDVVKDKRFCEEEEEFYYCCMQYYSQNLIFDDFYYAIAESAQNKKTVRPVKYIYDFYVGMFDKTKDINEQQKNIIEQINAVMKKLDNLVDCSMEERNNLLGFCEEYWEMIYTAFLKVVEDRVLNPEKVSGSRFLTFCDPDITKCLEKYVNVWKECNRKGFRPFKNIDFDYNFSIFIRHYSYARFSNLRFLLPGNIRVMALFLNQMMGIYKYEALGRYSLERKGRIVTFNWSCDITLACVLLYELILDAKSNGIQLDPNEFNDISILHTIQSWQKVMETMYMAYRDYIPNNLLIKYMHIQYYIVLFNNKISPINRYIENKTLADAQKRLPEA